MTLDFDPRLTFDTFVVGPANRLASAAARRVAHYPGRSYNPLFIYSASGLGKSHILAAVAHHATRSNGPSKVLYQAVESYVDELARALRGGGQDELRDRYRSLDLLLLDDVQFLAGQRQAQEILLSTLDALTTSGGQIVLASDRPPAEINDLDARLVSRFSGGLIVDIGPPEYETRVAIIRRKAEEAGQELQAGVAEALARSRYRNVRELGGALNRVLAIQELEERSVTAAEVMRLMGDAPEERSDDFGAFVQEIAVDVASAVETQELPWRHEFGQAAGAAEREGFIASRLRVLLERHEAPSDWEEVLRTFKVDLARLREIESELDRLGNPWPEAAQALIRDPERLPEAEALLDAVSERQRPFRVLGAGPGLRALEGSLPPLAIRAADQLVREEKPRYNPLFFWGPRPDAGLALLGGAARTYRERVPHGTAAVTSVTEFAEDFIRALSSGVAGAWRERWWTVDLLLVHGVEALADTERAQDEFFHLFEALKRRGSRILLASDRPPSVMTGIDDRLRSRFEGGLVLRVTSDDLPAGAADLTLLEAPPPEEEVPESQRVGGPAHPGEAVAAGFPGAPSATDAGRALWVPSRENVVWNWPRTGDRIVEDLE